MLGRTMDQLNVGDFEVFSKTITETDIYLFAGISGDLNPSHVDEQFSADTYFKGRIAHGVLVGSLISTVVGMKLPGPGSIYMEQSYKFLSPVRIGDTITARGEVIEKIEDKKRVVLKTTCTNQEGVVVIEGQALVSPPRPKS